MIILIKIIFAILAGLATFPIMIVCIVWSLFIWKLEPFAFWNTIIDDIADIAKNKYNR